MSSLLAQMRSRPSLFALAGTVGLTCVTACVYGLHKMNGDQDLVYDSKRDPFPYLRSREQPHLMVALFSPVRACN